MPRLKVLLTFLCAIVLGFHSYAQMDTLESVESLLKKKETVKVKKKRAESENNAVLIMPYYTAQFPVGELSNRFGFCNNVGMNMSLKVRKNFIIGIEGAFLFGSKVKENPLNPISTASTAQIIGLDGTLGDIPLQLSGYQLAFRVGRLFTLMRRHPNSGIVLSVAPGFMQHKIWIHANTNNYPQLDDTYKKGYDRMTNGASVGGSLGYLYLEKKKFLSFYGGIDFACGFTQERRNWNFDLMSADTHHRLDMMVGIKLAWIIPVFTNKDDAVYYR